MNHLGSLTIYFCWIVLISGIWLIFFFRTSVSGAFDSLEYLSREQWYLGGIMRSLHRYASDAAIVLLLLHVVKEFSFDRYRSKRWFSWVTGLPLVWMLFPLGITGYWLVWDELAQYVAITSAELLDRIPIFTDSMAGNFLSDAALSDRFFTLMAFLHLVGLPIFLVFGIWLHVFRLSRPEINPPRRLMAGALIAMLVLSLVFPAQSQDKADLALAAQTLKFDWFYLHSYPLVQAWSPGWVWMLLIAISSLILLAPWLPPGKAQKPAVVSLDNCNGCKRCADDCPYGAITMAPRSDGNSYLHEAVVDANLCVSCGICVGACPTATPFRIRSELVPGIDLPARTASELRVAIGKVSSTLRGEGRALVFACRGSREAKRLSAAGEPFVEVECMGQIPPSYFDYVLSRDHADGIFLAGCADLGCRFRLGSDWTRQRIGRTRDPRLRKRIDDSRISMNWQESPGGNVLQRLVRFRAALKRAADEGVQ
ncbi:MAG: cytochrome b N-terminal domain-containing protein [Gammaproteobacteria bacterium]|nr:cytochrome b N-terminal domain-containing protein [Gammaproteobacteria bacterium]MDH4315546.1 cytochrome b N-terminal domain-containing protein [Gammaproteobacteria bacterium]MDH5215560.1 cytochrome b N-terminal domain-containing protein [Gammaproteobacteria bacterium]MDH5501494.1 cytochrome b N-terminal domain-containing protein [Gammaproteobacteria bacterium]